MAVPPSYCDLGKSAKDIFNKGYGFGLVKLDVKTRTASGVEFKAAGSSKTDSVSGTLETKYKMSDYGLTFTEKFNTDNTMELQVTLEDQIAKGLKVTFDSTFSPNTGNKSGKIKTAYKREYVNLGCDVDLLARPTVHGAAVVDYEGWLAGYQVSFDTARSMMTQNNFAIGYRGGDYQLHASVNDFGREFGSSVYHQVNNKLETAVNMAWVAGGNSPQHLGIAAKYQLDKDAAVSAKVDNASHVGLGYTQTLRPGVKLTLSALVDGKNFNAGGHKLGLGLELEA